MNLDLFSLMSIILSYFFSNNYTSLILPLNLNVIILNSIIPYPVRSYLFLSNKKCRIYAVRGVSQTPNYIKGVRGCRIPVWLKSKKLDHIEILRNPPYIIDFYFSNPL